MPIETERGELIARDSNAKRAAVKETEHIGKEAVTHTDGAECVYNGDMRQSVKGALDVKENKVPHIPVLLDVFE